MDFHNILAKNNFLVIGRGAMDIYATPAGARIEQAESFVSMIGGSAANTAVAIARHGGDAALVTTVSDDAVGRFVTNQLRKYGVDPQYVTVRGGELRTQVSVVETRIEDCQSVLYRNGAADFQMFETDIAPIPFHSFGGIVIAGTVFAADPSRSAAFKALDMAKQSRVPIVFDVDYRPYSWRDANTASEILTRAGQMADIIVGNDEEFGFMAGDHAKGFDLARQLAATSARIVIYKMGEHGAITLSGGTEIRTGIFPVTALKPTGAGDSFMGGFLSALAAGLDLQTAILRGSASAAIVVGKVGCSAAMPDTAELDSFLATHPGPTVFSDR